MFQTVVILLPPAHLPVNVHAFLANVLNQPWATIAHCWDIFSVVVWSHTDTEMHTQRPTLTLCQPSWYDMTLFTKAEGTLEIFSHSLSAWTYYGGIPEIIQVMQQHFFESVLLELQANQMCFAWELSANCARIYNEALKVPDAHRVNNEIAFANTVAPQVPLLESWTLSLSMGAAHVLDGFFLYSLLLDKMEHSGIPVLPHDAVSQRLCLEGPSTAQNASMEGFGQEYYNYTCDLCCLIYGNEEGELVNLQGAMSDGNTISHPCCGIHDCMVPLANSAWDIYCPVHLGLETKCAVTGCESRQDKGFLTWGGVPGDSVAEEDTCENDAVVVGGDNSGATEPALRECDEKLLGGNCRRTHNKELMIHLCRVIISWVMFFGSEAISAVREFMLATFPTPESMPKVFYDTNCGLLKHCRNIGCTHFDHTVVVVDLFHFNWKHKESDSFCQENCNPALFPELYINGKWVFNSSIAEQTNVWFEGFLAIVWEMSVLCFNVLLDEMIKRCNHYIVSELEQKGHHPWSMPMSVLMPATPAT
ncbi:hypothetical protein K439DRAFT_1648540 [Ramaria rubella]|nr:hypothetical protein K439DRAFT_1648540 [Ramaria rubella]